MAKTTTIKLSQDVRIEIKGGQRKQEGPLFVVRNFFVRYIDTRSGINIGSQRGMYTYWNYARATYMVDQTALPRLPLQAGRNSGLIDLGVIRSKPDQQESAALQLKGFTNDHFWTGQLVLLIKQKVEQHLTHQYAPSVETNFLTWFRHLLHTFYLTGQLHGVEVAEFNNQMSGVRCQVKLLVPNSYIGSGELFSLPGYSTVGEYWNYCKAFMYSTTKYSVSPWPIIYQIATYYGLTQETEIPQYSGYVYYDPNRMTLPVSFLRK